MTEKEQPANPTELTLALTYSDGTTRRVTIYQPSLSLTLDQPPVRDEDETQRQGWMVYRAGPEMHIKLTAHGLVKDPNG